MTKETIQMIKDKLQAVTHLEDPYLGSLESDERKGVAKLLAQKKKELEKLEDLKTERDSKLLFEKRAWQNGYAYIAGVDEVGRGPLAGPVVAAAVIFDQEVDILGIDDSKKLSKKALLSLYEEIQDKALAIGIGQSSPAEIDRLNILQASRQAMKEAVEALDQPAQALLIDAETIDLNIPQKALIKGDSLSLSIGAASIVAKVTRDRLMAEYDQRYPGYGFSKNVGYGTAEHLAGLKKHGPCPIHRKTFSPVKNYF